MKPSEIAPKHARKVWKKEKIGEYFDKDCVIAYDVKPSEFCIYIKTKKGFKLICQDRGEMSRSINILDHCKGAFTDINNGKGRIIDPQAWEQYCAIGVAYLI